MNNNINNILEKYWNAEASLQEEAELSAYFASADVVAEHIQYAPLFSSISQNQLMQSNLDVSKILNSINDIDTLITKYTNAETTLEEESILRSYFSGDDITKEHLKYKPLFDFYKVAGQMITDIDFNIEAIISNNNIDTLISKYLNVETTLEDERTLNAYFQSSSIEEKHLEYKPMFAFFDQAAEMKSEVDIASILTETTDIDTLLDKYWNAETNLEEEKSLHTYFSNTNVESKHLANRDLFIFFANQKSASSNLDIEEVLVNKEASSGSAASDNTVKPQANKAKVFSMKRMASAIAAVFILGFAAITVMNQNVEPDTQYRGKYVQLDTEAEAQEAYEITKQAFALLSKKMNKGSKAVNTSMKKAENASIFK